MWAWRLPTVFLSRRSIFPHPPAQFFSFPTVSQWLFAQPQRLQFSFKICFRFFSCFFLFCSFCFFFIFCVSSSLDPHTHTHTFVHLIYFSTQGAGQWAMGRLKGEQWREMQNKCRGNERGLKWMRNEWPKRMKSVCRWRQRLNVSGRRTETIVVNLRVERNA